MNVLDVVRELRKVSGYLIKIGAFDGVTNDPINFSRCHGWTGVLLEPIPWIFERLAQHYPPDDGWDIRRAAMGYTSGEGEIYYIEESLAVSAGLPNWTSQTASLKDTHHTNIFGDKADGLVKKMVVPLLTWEQVLVDSPDITFLHVDTEGLDAGLLLDFPWGSVRDPQHVYFEHIHSPQADLDRLDDLLRSRGYVIHRESYDVYATNCCPRNA